MVTRRWDVPPVSPAELPALGPGERLVASTGHVWPGPTTKRGALAGRVSLRCLVSGSGPRGIGVARGGRSRAV